jgi:hypothetical protein
MIFSSLVVPSVGRLSASGRMRSFGFFLLLFIPILFRAAALKADGLLISEFMAANASGKQDEDGDFSDWIEIQNISKIPVSLAGWGLSDDSSDLFKWRFPNTTLPPSGFLLVFADATNRTNTAALHANFKLNRDGGYLALTPPSGIPATVFDPYPRQLADVSFGYSFSRQSNVLVATNAFGRLLVPPDNSLGQTWTDPAFDDSLWTEVINGVGYDRVPPGEGDPFEPASGFADVTSPGDPILATSLNSPGNEGVGNAIDNNTATKYLNFDKIDAGFTVVPSKGASVITGLNLTSANDEPSRDPASFTLFGSNDGQNFTQIATGPVPRFTARFQTVQITFSNTVAYQQYHLIFPTLVNAPAAVAMQIAEVEFLGKIGPEPVPLSQFIRTSVESSLFNSGGTAIYLRFPFVVGPDIIWDDLRLLLRYDDGFAAWLNGAEIANANAPAGFPYNGLAKTNHFRRDSSQQTLLNLNTFISGQLHSGTNYLAIAGWNDRGDSPDFLLEAQLENSRRVFGQPGYFDQPTPGVENVVAQLGLVDDPILSQPRGFYSSAFALELSCATENAVIRYTTDGSAPSLTNGVQYTQPIPIERTTVLRAAAFRDSWHDSRVVTASYIFLGDVVRQNRAQSLAAGFPANWNGQSADYGLDSRIVGPNPGFGGKYALTITNDLKAIPSMSIVIPMEDMFGPQGIYANPLNHGEGWERPGSIEFFSADGQPGFQEDAGFRIQGGAFRRFDLTLKKSFRVIFRNKYGRPALKFPLFGDEAAQEINNFVLRANSNDAWPYAGGSAVYVRDTFAMQTIREMGNVASHSRFVHLYINGFYWGLYNPAERPDAAFSAAYHGGEKENWDAINQDSAPDGNYDAWNRMSEMLNLDFTQNENYQKIQGNNPDGTRNSAYEDLLDVDTMIDYMIMNFYIGNTDWPGRNWWASRDRDNGDGFKFHPWDSETALGFSGLNVNVTGVDTAAARPYAVLRNNADFRLRFADHVHRHFFNGGVFYVNPASTAWNPAKPENNRPAERFFNLSETISRAIVGETARWGDQLRSTPYTRDENWLTARNSLLTGFFPQRSAIVLQQFRAAGLYPNTAAPVMNVPGGSVDPGFSLVMTATQGSIYYTTNGTDPRFATNGILYSGSIPITGAVVIKARAKNGAEWSALNEASFQIGAPSLVISELNYHPANPTTEEQLAGFSSEDEFEFVELWNNGTGVYNLAGVQFTNGIRFDFTNSMIQQLAPGHFLLLARNGAALEKRYGPGLPVAGIYSGKLDNNGEKIQAVNAAGDFIFNFTYGAAAPWPVEPDGGGVTLEISNPDGDLNLPANWRAGFIPGGTPGKPNPLPPIKIELLEFNRDVMRIAFPGRKGLGYHVYVSDSLLSPHWIETDFGGPRDADGRVEISVLIRNFRAEQFFKVSVP